MNFNALIFYLSIGQEIDEDWTDIIWDLIDTGIDVLGQVGGSLLQAFFDFIENWITMNNAFWTTLILIFLLAVYIILKKVNLA